MVSGRNILTPAQCRAARALINMTQNTLADLADLSAVTLNQFENGKRIPGLVHLLALRAALEVEGVIFIDQRKYGRGVQLRARDEEWTIEP